MSAGDRGPLARTLRDLVERPGTITRALLDGAGKDYVPLGRLLLAFAFVFFALTYAQQRTPGGASPYVAAACADAADKAVLDALIGAAAAQGNSSPDAIGILNVASDALCQPQRYTRAFSLAVPIAFLLLMPLSAMLMMVAFRKEMPAFAGNWTYGLEAHAALFALLAVLAAVSLLGFFLLSLCASIGGLVYASWNVVAGVQRAYRVNQRVAIWKTTAVGVVYALVLTVVSVLLIWAMV